MQDQNFIDNEWRPARSGATDDILNPATGAVIGTAPASDAADVDDAVAAAAKAFPEWAAKTPRERSEAIHELARRIEADIENLSAIESENVGKPVSIMEFEMDLTLDNWKFFASAGRFLEGRAAGEYMAGYTSMLRREPLGRDRLDRAVELPAQHGHLEGRARAHGRQHGRAQAVRAHAVHRAAPRRAGGRRAAARRAQRGVRPGRDGGRGAGRPRRRGDGVAHRLGGRRQGDRQGVVGDAEARAPRAGRQGAGRRVRRRRRGRRGRGRAGGGLLQLRPGLHRRLPRDRGPEGARRRRRRRCSPR